MTNKQKQNQIKKPQSQEPQQQEQQQEPTPAVVADSTENVNREVIEILNKGKERIKHAIIVSDEKLTKTKTEIVKETAEDMEKAGYPKHKICNVIAKAWKALVSERTVENALDEKYKDPEQSRVGKMGGIHGGRNNFGQQPKGPKSSQVIKSLKEQVKDLRQDNEDLTEENEDLKKNMKELKEIQKRNCVSMRKFWLEISDPKIPDKEIAERIRNTAKPTIDYFNSEIRQLDLELDVESIIESKIKENKK